MAQHPHIVNNLNSLKLQTEALLSSEDCGRDLASVESLVKKHGHVEADILAHEVVQLSYMEPYLCHKVCPVQ